jgi:hypothetical protein
MYSKAKMKKAVSLLILSLAFWNPLQAENPNPAAITIQLEKAETEQPNLNVKVEGVCINPHLQNAPKTKKYEFSVCALIKNEEKYLKEWLEYHKMLGVDHFYLYNNDSRDRTREVLAPYIKEGLVTLVDWPTRVPLTPQQEKMLWPTMIQLPAYEHAAKYLAINDTKWLTVLDVDEFIVPVKANTIKEVLANCDEFPGIEMVTHYFDASRGNQFPKKNLIIQSVEFSSKPDKDLERETVKMIHKPDIYTCYTWPPYKCHFAEGKEAEKISKGELRVNKYLHRSKGPLQAGKKKDKFPGDYQKLSDEEFYTILEVGFEVEDQEKAIFRFVPELLKKMGFDSPAF